MLRGVFRAAFLACARPFVACADTRMIDSARYFIGSVWALLVLTDEKGNPHTGRKPLVWPPAQEYAVRRV